MDNIEALLQSEDGPTLRKLAEGGDNEARVAFADLVLYRGYQGTRRLIGTKKAARKQAFNDALRFINEAVEDGHFRALRFRADINLQGVFDPRTKQRIHPKDFHGAERDYRALLSHPQCPEKDRGEFLLRLGEAMLYQDQVKGHRRQEKALAHLREAVEYPDQEAAARHVLAGVLWRHSAYEEAVSHARSCYEDYPWAAMILHMAYQNGQGVEANMELADWYYDYWEKMMQG